MTAGCATSTRHLTDAFIIRPARPDDLVALPVIEHAAAVHFRTTPYAYLADDDPVSAEVDLAQEFIWVVVDQDDHPIAFAIVHLLDESVHLHELDVHPDNARQGLGSGDQARPTHLAG
jgi:ribosomal protein S18 acetylase RimI-like enzyme